MIAYLIRRLFAAVIMMAVVSLITFAIFFLVPKLGGQTTASLAARFVGRQQNPQAIAAVVHKFGFDQPWYVQYWDYIHNIIFGSTYSDGVNDVKCTVPCLGYSYRESIQIYPTIISRLPITISIAIGAAVIWLVTGVSAGIISALKRGSVYDRTAMFIALAGVSLPVYFVGPVLQLFFSYHWQIFPDVSYVPFTQNPLTWADHMVIPWVTVAFGTGALYARLSRVGMLETMGEDYIRTARAKGLPERTVIFKHALRAALTPIVTIFGMDLGFALGGVVLAEIVFSLHGIGDFALEGIQNDDLPVMMGVTLFAAMFVILANVLVDMLYGVVDPRVRSK